ncbi:TPA: lipopolysaccharide biosynthesis protein [Morganella morganii]|nr:lipopolysaccharide biosynthesis protein [Morganella morganii]
MSEQKSQTANGIKWSAIERLATQFVQLITMLIIARLIGPSSFGLIGILSVFIAVSQIIIDSGLSSALIRKNTHNDDDYITVFFFNTIIAILCYIILFISSPYISNFYDNPELTLLLRTLSIIIIINSFSIIQKTKLTIMMDFKTQAKASLTSVSFSCILALYLAYQNMGAWALVFQTISFSLLNTIFLNIYHPWKPKGKVKFSIFKELFGFGYKLMLSSLINSLYENVYLVIIGKKFSLLDVGFYTQSNQLVSTPAVTITNIIQRVTYPMLSKIKDNHETLNNAYLTTLRLSSSVIFPLLLGLSVTADILVPLILGDEWKPAAVLVSILSLGLLLYPLHAINLNYLQVKGRSDLFLKLEIIKKIIGTLILIITIPYGIIAICIGIVIQSYISLLINTYYNGKLGQLTFAKQFKSIFPLWLLSLTCCFFAKFSSEHLFSSPIYILFSTILISAILYITSVKIFQPDIYRYLIPSIHHNKLKNYE